MKTTAKLILSFSLIITGLTFITNTSSAQTKADSNLVYAVKKLKKPMKIDANWDKKEWKKIKAVDITHLMGATPKFMPKSQAKMMYDDKNIYLIFRTDDKFMKSTVETVNGGVSRDACVEFFFNATPQKPDSYMHLEVSSTGAPFFAYDSVRRRDLKFKAEEMAKFEVVSSHPGKIDPEMTEPLTWTLEVRIPIDVLLAYTPNMILPKKGNKWKANFFKTANQSSNTHYLTWNIVGTPRPDFHTPAFFGTVEFK